MKLGFDYYDTPEVVELPTTSELIASLTNTQKTGILNGYAQKVRPNRLKFVLSVDKSIIIHLYREIENIEQYTKLAATGQIVLTEAVLDEEGNVVTEATYNDKPTTITALKNLVTPEFIGDFTILQVKAIVDKVLAYSKHDGTGTFAYYIVEVNK